MGLIPLEQAVGKAQNQGKQENAEELSKGVAEEGENRRGTPCPIARSGEHQKIKEGDEGKGQGGGKGHRFDPLNGFLVHCVSSDSRSSVGILTN